MKFKLPDPVWINETWGFQMTREEYAEAMRNPPKWWEWLIPWGPHPFKKYVKQTRNMVTETSPQLAKLKEISDEIDRS